MRESKNMGCVTVLAAASEQTQLVAQSLQLSPQSPWNYFSKLSLMRTKGKQYICQLPSFSRREFLDLWGSRRESRRGPVPALIRSRGCLFHHRSPDFQSSASSHSLNIAIPQMLSTLCKVISSAVVSILLTSSSTALLLLQVTICSPDNFPEYLSQSKPQLFVRPTSGLREAALGAEEVVSDHNTLPRLVRAKGTEGSVRPRAISLWAGGAQASSWREKINSPREWEY